MKTTSRAMGWLALAAIGLGPATTRAGDQESPVVDFDASADTEVDPSLDADPDAPVKPDEAAAARVESEAEAEAEAKSPSVVVVRRTKTGPAPKLGTDSWDRERLNVPWARRWAPEKHVTELGVYVGVTIFSLDHELYEVDSNLDQYGWKPLARVGPSFGFRAGYYPIRHFGMEGEVTATPIGVPDADGGAFGYSARAQLIAQLGLWSVTPFVGLGVGTLGLTSARETLGNNRDPIMTLGGGLKFFLTRHVALRLEGRNLFSREVGPESGGTSHQEILLGVFTTLGRLKNKMPQMRADTDKDGDGWIDVEDECLVIPGVEEFRGCPVPDTDGDGVLDPDDKCPDQTGTEDYEGCPAPDSDGDCFLDDVDACPDEKGIEPDGCPIGDTDGDGIFDDVDECIDEPEEINNYQDEDGCPDDLPEEVSRFSGVIEGVHFESNKSTIKEDSKTILDEAAEVLDRYALRVEIAGHTDSKGKEPWNMKLSQARAQAVRDYLESKGVGGDQLETVGWGPHKPIDSNESSDGRAKNRRIEFRLLEYDEHAPTASERDDEIARIKSDR